MPAMPAARLPIATRARRSVMPCAFQCVSAHANVSGNCFRATLSSDAAYAVCL